MIKENNTAEHKEVIMTQMVKALIKSYSTPCLEFVDILIESIMYPTGFKESPGKLLKNCLSLKKSNINPDGKNLGHPILFELVALKHMLQNLQDKEEDCVKSQRRINETNALLHNIHNRLIMNQKILKRTEFYTTVLTKHDDKFQEMFKLLDHLSEIITLVKDQNTVAEKELVKKMDTFATKSISFYNTLLSASVAKQDFIEYVGHDVKEQNDFANDKEFITFLNKRKVLLHICNRRIF